jgi:CRISPR-associated protein Cas2
MSIRRTRRLRQKRDQLPAPPLSGFKLMWLLVMFDLPVDTPEDRKAANGFRHDLLDFGFERCQFSVYLRFCEGREQADTWVRRVQAVLPSGGRVYCLFFTDKQYEGIIRFERKLRQKPKKNPGQYELF